MFGHGTQCVLRRDTLVCAQRHTALGQAAHCAPDGFQHIRRQDGRVLMESEPDAPVKRRTRRTDARCSFQTKIPDVRVSPVVYMRDEK